MNARVALIAICVLLVAIGPLALTLLRTEYDASTSIAQNGELSGYTRAQEVGGVKLIMGAIINSPEARRAVARQVPWLDSPDDVARRVSLDARWRQGQPEALITARASTPEEARELASAASEVLEERAELVARLEDTYERTLRREGEAFSPPAAVRSEDGRPVDAALAALPGRLPPPPAPGWAALAGLALAATLIFSVRRGREGPQPDGA